MMELDCKQLVALKSLAPLKVIVAGPGSGKTRTLVAMLARECTRFEAQQVAVLTFTNAAADEIKERLARDAHMDTKLGFCGTLHSFLFLLLRSYPGESCLPGSVALIEPESALEMLETVRVEMGVRIPAKGLIESYDRVFKGWVMNHPDKAFPPYDAGDSKDEIVAKAYFIRLASSGLMTFDTLLVFGLQLVRRLTQTGRWPYKAVLWDEGQDGSYEDFDILEACGAERKVIVGDPDQSIYGFRGAAPGRLAALTTGDKWETTKLESNYRSTISVCAAANALIAHQLDRVPKITIPTRIEPGLAEMCACDSQGHEITLVLLWISGYIATGSSYSDIAILARTRHRASVFSAALLANGIPVRTRPEEAPAPKDWKQAKLLLTVAAAPWSDFAVYSYVAAREGREIAEKIRRQAQLEGKAMKGLYFGAGDLEWLVADDARLTPANVADLMALHSISRESIEKAHGIAEELGGRLDPRNLAAALSEPLEKPDEGDMRGVTICTVHAAKGREFKHVFIVGMEDDSFPSRKSLDIQEERRLFFVALTRARDTVTCTWCREMAIYRGPKVQPGPAEPKEPSRFLAEAGL